MCCPTCWASDKVLAFDRHTSLHGENPYLKKIHALAPENCKGAKCFKPHCLTGQTLGYVKGKCCESCVKATESAQLDASDVQAIKSDKATLSSDMPAKDDMPD